MKLTKLLRTNKGFTLAETMIGLGVSTIVLLGVAQSFEMLSQGKKSIELGSSATEWTQELRQTMKTTQCQATLAGKAFPASMGASLTLNSVSMGGKTYTKGADMGRGMILKDVQLIRNSSSGTSMTYQATPSSSKVQALSYVGVLRVQLEKPAASMGGKAMPPAYIPVRVTTDMSNKVLDCTNVGDLTASTCSDLNFIWDAATEQCRYRLGQCQYAGSYVSKNFTNGATTGGFVNPFTNDYSCPAGEDYQARVAGSFNKAESCGKGCVRNLLAPVYECVKCYDAAGKLIAPGGTATLTYVPADIKADDDIDEGTASVDKALTDAIDQLQSAWVDSAAACYPSGQKFSGVTCNTSGGGYTQEVPASMCCSGLVKICRNGFTFSLTGEPATKYYVPNYMGCK